MINSIHILQLQIINILLTLKCKQLDLFNFKTVIRKDTLNYAKKEKKSTIKKFLKASVGQEFSMRKEVH